MNWNEKICVMSWKCKTESMANRNHFRSQSTGFPHLLLLSLYSTSTCVAGVLTSRLEGHIFLHHVSDLWSSAGLVRNTLVYQTPRSISILCLCVQYSRRDVGRPAQCCVHLVPRKGENNCYYTDCVNSRLYRFLGDAELEGWKCLSDHMVVQKHTHCICISA